MSPVTHLLAGWVVANAADLRRRDRALVTAASLVPDADGAGIVAEVLTRNSERPLLWWSEGHHVFGHNAGFAVLVALAAFMAARRKTVTAALSFLAFHLHLLGDLVGARGPDGYQWPIPYLLPLTGRWQIVWSGQWALNGWPNMVITALLLAVTLHLAWRKGRSPLGLVSPGSDAALAAALRARFGDP